MRTDRPNNQPNQVRLVKHNYTEHVRKLRAFLWFNSLIHVSLNLLVVYNMFNDHADTGEYFNCYLLCYINMQIRDKLKHQSPQRIHNIKMTLNTMVEFNQLSQGKHVILLEHFFFPTPSLTSVMKYSVEGSHCVYTTIYVLYRGSCNSATTQQIVTFLTVKADKPFSGQFKKKTKMRHVQLFRYIIPGTCKKEIRHKCQESFCFLSKTFHTDLYDCRFRV